MKISDRGLEFIEFEEGFRSKPYLCPAGIPTIGIGTTMYPNGVKVTLKDKPITKAYALEMLKIQCDNKYGAAINKKVSTTLTQNQFDALCSFVYNIGVGAFGKSTMLKLLNLGRMDLAALQFSRWNKVNGKPNKTLISRRKRETALFTKVD